MSYNPYTKLLLNFNGSDGALSTIDTSQAPFAALLSGHAQISLSHGKFTTTSLQVGDPDGTGGIGALEVTSPSGLLSNDRQSAKVFDFWFLQGLSGPPWGNHPLFSVTFQNGDTVAFWRGAISLDCEINGINTDGSYTYASYTDYSLQGEWAHYRVAINGQTLFVGKNGEQVLSEINSTSNNLWVGSESNPITQFRIGGFPIIWGADENAYARGWVDCFQVLDGDTSWLGGAYEVPIEQPTDYQGGGGEVTIYGHGESEACVSSSGDGGAEQIEILGNCSSTVDDVISIGYVEHSAAIDGSGSSVTEEIMVVASGILLNEISAASSTTIDDLIVSGGGTVIFAVVGSNTVANVTSTGFGGDVAANDYAIMTTLMLHGNSAGLLKDDSIHATNPTGSNVSLSITPPTIGDGSIQFAASVNNANGGEILPVLGRGLFFDLHSDKIFDFVLNLSETTYSTVGILGLSFPVTPYWPGSSSSVNLLANTTTRKFTLSVITPAVNTTVETAISFNLGTRVFVRLAFIGQNCYLCANGVQRAVIESFTGGNIWPETTYPSAFKIGTYFNSFFGTLDEFRVQEGSSVNTGYSGGNYTVNTNEWWWSATSGVAANTTEHTIGSGDGLVIPVLSAIGASTTEYVVGEGSGNVGEFRDGIGANTVDDFAGTGGGTALPPVLCAGISIVENFTSSGTYDLSWVGLGANVVELLVTISSGTTLEVASVGMNTVGTIYSSSAGLVLTVGGGTNTTLTETVCFGTTSAVAAGGNITESTSNGVAAVSTSAIGSSVIFDAVSVGVGAAQINCVGVAGITIHSLCIGDILISGYGSNTVEAVAPEKIKSGYLMRADILLPRVDIVLKTRRDVLYVRAV